MPAASRRPRRRARTVIAVAALLATALPAADALARHQGESRLADRIASRHPDLRSAPQVRIDGYPFLLDAARGSHPEVRVSADAVTADGHPVRADVDLREVCERPGGYSASEVDARFTVPFDSLGARTDRALHVSDAGDGRLRIERRAFGIPVVITARPHLENNTVTLQASAATLAGHPVDPATPVIAQALAERRWELPALPLGLRASEVTVGPDGVTAHARGERVALG
ncbi:DUF2993 domain-containing protein [Streptomyces sp. NPDC032472]|uniref:LmeA family phospholipid-binding protein n=1 Tax=Streptomyces sp. NPDC032472 TaxID=3155018 RepID=UPI0033EF4ACA